LLPRGYPESVAEISALLFARPEKQISLHLMPLASWLAPGVASESVSASLISFVLIFAIALRVRRDFSTAVSSLPYSVRGGTPKFVETSHTAGKVFFTVTTDEDLQKTWLGGVDRLCSRSPSHSIPLALRVRAGSLTERMVRASNRLPARLARPSVHPSKRFNTPLF